MIRMPAFGIVWKHDQKVNSATMKSPRSPTKERIGPDMDEKNHDLKFDEAVAQNAIHKTKIRKLEAELEACAATEARLTSSLQESEKQSNAYKTGKEELFLAVVQLNNRIEEQNKTAAKARIISTKLVKVPSSQGFNEDDASKLRNQLNDAVNENMKLIKVVDTLNLKVTKQAEQITALRSENTVINYPRTPPVSDKEIVTSQSIILLEEEIKRLRQQTADSDIQNGKLIEVIGELRVKNKDHLTETCSSKISVDESTRLVVAARPDNAKKLEHKSTSQSTKNLGMEWEAKDYPILASPSQISRITSSLKLHDDEAMRLRQEKNDAEIENEKLSKLVENMLIKERSQLDELNALRKEIEEQQTSFDDPSMLLERVYVSTRNKVPFLSTDVIPESEEAKAQRIKIENLETELSDIKASAHKLTNSLSECQLLTEEYKNGKEELFSALLSLNNRIEIKKKDDDFNQLNDGNVNMIEESNTLILDCPVAVTALKLLNDHILECNFVSPEEPKSNIELERFVKIIGCLKAKENKLQIIADDEVDETDSYDTETSPTFPTRSSLSDIKVKRFSYIRENSGLSECSIETQIDDDHIVESNTSKFNNFINCNTSSISSSAVSTPKRVQFDLPPFSLEDERKDKVRIEKLETDLLDMTSSLQESQNSLKFHKDTKEVLALTVENLNEIIEMKDFDAQNVWSKLPVVVAALKRLDEETLKLRRERLDSETEKKNLNRTIDYLREDNDERLEDISTLRAEVENLSNAHNREELMKEMSRIELKESKSSYDNLAIQYQESVNLLEIIQKENEEFTALIIELKAQIEMQNKVTAEAEIVLLKLPAAVRALKRLDEENVLFRSTTESEKEDLNKVIIELKESLEVNDANRSKEVSVLKEALELSTKGLHDCELTLERVSPNKATSISSFANTFKETKNNSNNTSNSNLNINNRACFSNGTSNNTSTNNSNNSSSNNLNTLHCNSRISTSNTLNTMSPKTSQKVNLVNDIDTKNAKKKCWLK